MGAVITVDIDRLPEALELGERAIRRAIASGALMGAHRGRAIAVRATPTDQGQLRASWKVRPGATEFAAFDTVLAELVNDAPHAAIVDLGARPHKVSPEGWAAIYEWVRRHYRGGRLGGTGRMRRARGGEMGAFSGPDPVIAEITNAIVWKIRKHGQRPTFFVKGMMADLTTAMAYEVERALAKAHRDLAKGRR